MYVTSMVFADSDLRGLCENIVTSIDGGYFQDLREIKRQMHRTTQLVALIRPF